MADILSFRAKAQAASDAGSEQDFLHKEDHTLSFQVTETGRVGITNILEHRSETPEAPALNDWSNQELADLYRVKRLLDAAGVPNELDRGLTDEGDPWLVFVGPDGEVFIHLCRLDGTYVLDSPNIQAPLRGADFNALIEAFTNRALPRTGTTADTGDSRVIRLERGGKVYLHPSALLAALIWTLFLAAEEIVLMTPDADQMAGGLDDISTMTFGDVRTEGHNVPVILPESEALIEGHMDASTPNDPRQVAAHEAFLRDNGTGGSSGLTMMHNSYGMGLSTIAIAFGFMADQVLSDDKMLTGDDVLAMDDANSVDEDGDTRVVADDTTQQNADITLTENVKLAIELTPDTLLATDEIPVETVMAATDAVATGQVLTDGVQAVQNKAAKNTVEINTSFEDAAHKTIVTAQAAVEEETPAAAQSTTVDTKAASPLPASFTLSTLKTALLPFEMESYAVGNVAVLASFNLNEETISILPFLDQGNSIDAPGLITLEPLHTTGLRAFDSEARSFMNFLLGKHDAVEMISLGKELILIDSAVFNGSDSYVASWSLDDGGVVSIVGQRSEFADFHLIA